MGQKFEQDAERMAYPCSMMFRASSVRLEGRGCLSGWRLSSLTCLEAHAGCGWALSRASSWRAFMWSVHVLWARRLGVVGLLPWGLRAPRWALRQNLCAFYDLALGVKVTLRGAHGMGEVVMAIFGKHNLPYSEMVS